MFYTMDFTFFLSDEKKFYNWTMINVSVKQKMF